MGPREPNHGVRLALYFEKHSSGKRYQLTFLSPSIVFIHGLQGHPFRTWTHPNLSVHSNTVSREKQRQSGIKRAFAHLKRKSKRTGENSKDIQGFDEETFISRDPGTRQLVFWPYDLLPTACTEARILTWGYDTHVTKYYREPTSKANVFNLGKSLLYELARHRPRDRPLIFVAHSLGGIITKQVCNNSTIFSDNNHISHLP